MSSAKEELWELLNDRQKKEWLKAIEAVRIAFAWCVEVATPNGVTAGIPDECHRAEVLKLLFAFADAIKECKRYFHLLPNFLAIGQPGISTEQDLKKGEQQLSQLQSELEQLVQQEEALRKQTKEREMLQKTLQERKKELERLSQLADPQAVGALRQQVKELEEHFPPEGMEAEQLEREIQDKAGKLITLCENYLSALKPQLRSLLQEAETKEQELQELLRQLGSARERYDQVHQEAKKRKEELKSYIEADRIVAQSLPGAKDLLSLLDKAEEIIRDAERALKTIIKNNEQQAQCQPISITGEVLK